MTPIPLLPGETDGAPEVELPPITVIVSKKATVTTNRKDSVPSGAVQISGGRVTLTVNPEQPLVVLRESS
jgi:hypothetical protein